MNGYERMHPVPVQARADMLESVAGLDDEGMDRELAFGASALDLGDAESCRWLICLLARRVDEVTT